MRRKIDRRGERSQVTVSKFTESEVSDAIRFVSLGLLILVDLGLNTSEIRLSPALCGKRSQKNHRRYSQWRSPKGYFSVPIGRSGRKFAF